MSSFQCLFPTHRLFIHFIISMQLLCCICLLGVCISGSKKRVQRDTTDDNVCTLLIVSFYPHYRYHPISVSCPCLLRASKLVCSGSKDRKCDVPCRILNMHRTDINTWLQRGADAAEFQGSLHVQVNISLRVASVESSGCISQRVRVPFVRMLFGSC